MDREARGSRTLPCYDSGDVEGVWRSCGLVGVGAHDTAKRRAPMGVRWGMLLLGLGILSACTVVPTGPYALVFPAVGKSMDVFQVEEGACRVYARQQLGGAPEQAAPRACSRSSMTEPMSNVCTPKGMWCLGWWWLQGLAFLSPPLGTPSPGTLQR